MSLLKQWRDKAYDESANKGDLQRLWADYFEKEKTIYAQLLKDPDVEVTGSVKELAEKYGIDLMTMVGFLDGINDSLKTPNPIDEMDEDTVVSLGFDKEKLFKNMVAAGAEWLYELEEWKPIYDEEPASVSIWNRSSPGRSKRPRRSIPMIPAPAAPERNTKNATAETALTGLRQAMADPAF